MFIFVCRMTEPRVSRFLRDRILGQRGANLLRLHRFAEAIASIEEAIELTPDNALYYALLGDAADKAGLMKECIDAREQWLRRDVGKDENHEWLLNHLPREKPERLLAAAQRWTEVHRTSARAWNERAWTQVDPDIKPAVGDPADALSSAERAVEFSHGEEYGYLDTLALARRERPSANSTSEVGHFAESAHLAVLAAGETPALPVKSLEFL